jgi:hypothetical protein
MYLVLDPVEETDRRAIEKYWERRKRHPWPFTRFPRIRGGTILKTDELPTYTWYMDEDKLTFRAFPFQSL